MNLALDTIRRLRKLELDEKRPPRIAPHASERPVWTSDTSDASVTQTANFEAAGILADLTPEEREAFEERAGIMQYDAHLPRDRAEELAAVDILKQREQS